MPNIICFGGAAGADGVSVADATINGNGHLVLTLSDNTTVDAGVAKGADGVDGQNGQNGQDGQDGQDGVSVTDADINATGRLIITLSNGTAIDSGVAKGSNGTNGTNGTNGQDGANGATFTPTVSSSGVISWSNDKGLANPASVNIKGAKGDKGDTGDQGIQGVQGETGAAGYTPVKGTDYWTASDKAEIVSDTVDALENDGSAGTLVDISDYVVNQGTSGVWEYRKWASGIAECWCANTISVGITNSNYGFKTGNIARLSYPDGLFIATPCCVASISNVTGGHYAWMVANPDVGDKTRTCGFTIMSWVSGTSSITASYIAKGNWK